MTEDKLYDVLVIGGGINGVGIARDAAGRGLSVLLCEQDDLAAHTSSASTKLIHGGLRYLEYYEFNLVRKALQEREVLLRAAPHIVRPLRLVMPYSADMRPAWLIRAGLLIYDHLGKRELLPASEGIELRNMPENPLRHEFARGFAYSDARVDDARLVVLNALDAAEHGAAILPRTRLVSAERKATHWQVNLHSPVESRRQTVRARTLVNAAGPWVSGLLGDVLGIATRRHVRMAKGSHIVVPKLFEHDHAYILQNFDRRMTFVIPYEDEFTLIGTTDVAFEGDPSLASISTEEISYLCAMVNRYFNRQVSPQDVRWTYSGVRPLLDDEASDLSAVTRDYALEWDGDSARAPLLSVFGGKLTTYRRLAEDAMKPLGAYLNNGHGSWTAGAALPGGDIDNADVEAFIAATRSRYAWLPHGLLNRYARAYGTRVQRLLNGARSIRDLGAEFGDGLFEAEVRYLIDYEWARTAEDILWRRSKLGLHVGARTVRQLEAALPSLVQNSGERESNA